MYSSANGFSVNAFSMGVASCNVFVHPTSTPLLYMTAPVGLNTVALCNQLLEMAFDVSASEMGNSYATIWLLSDTKMARRWLFGCSTWLLHFM